MPNRKQNRRAPPISYRPPASQRAEFYRRVKQSGLSVSAFITKSVFDQDAPRQSRRPASEAKLLAQLLGQIAKIRDELDEIARQSGQGSENTLLLRKAIEALIEIRAALLKALGRKP